MGWLKLIMWVLVGDNKTGQDKSWYKITETVTAAA
jgi:hypothetical protein